MTSSNPDRLSRRFFVERRVMIILVSLLAGCFTVWALQPGTPSPGADDSAPSGSLTLLLAFIILSLFFSFICSVLEAILLSVTPSYVASLVKRRPQEGSRLRGLKENIDRPLAAILTLNTIAHTVGAIGAGAQAGALFSSRYVGVFSVVMTLLILYVSEIIPKTLGAVYWRSLAPLSARTLQFMIACLYPFIIISEQLTRLISRGKKRSAFSREEFTALADIGAQEGGLDEGESRVLTNLFRFPSLQVRDIMTPRTVMFTLQQDLAVSEVIEKHPQNRFSRIPIYGENRDDITGFVLRTDILLENAHDRHRTPLHQLKRDLPAITEAASLSTLLDFFLNHRAHISLVVGEYAAVGLVTLEDAVETLLGLEIVDEADANVDMQALAREKWTQRAQHFGLSTDESEE